MAEPRDSVLYSQIKNQIKSRVKRWPSAYASGQLVTAYKKAYESKYGKKGRPYVTRKSSSKDQPLARWFKEKWVNLCKFDGKAYAPCSKSASKQYPYCRPLKRISKSTPMTVSELTATYGASKIKSMCRRKQVAQRKTIQLNENGISRRNNLSIRAI